MFTYINLIRFTYDRYTHGPILELRNKSWKTECVLSFNMGWRISVFYLESEARDTIY